MQVVYARGAWLKVTWGPVLNLVCSPVVLSLSVKTNGHISGFDMLTDFDRAMHPVSDIQEVSGCIVRRVLFGTISWSCELPVGRDYYAMAYRRL